MNREEKIQFLKEVSRGKQPIIEMKEHQIFFQKIEGGLYECDGKLLTEEEVDAYPALNKIRLTPAPGCEPILDED